MGLELGPWGGGHSPAKGPLWANAGQVPGVSGGRRALCPGSPGGCAEKLFLLNLSRTFLEPSTLSRPLYHPVGSASAVGSMTKSINKSRSAAGSSRSHHKVMLTPERPWSWVGLGCLGANELELGGTFCGWAGVTRQPWPGPAEPVCATSSDRRGRIYHPVLVSNFAPKRENAEPRPTDVCSAL